MSDQPKTGIPAATQDGARWRPTTLEASLGHYKSLIDAIGCIVWEGDPHSYVFTFVSQEAERVLGYPVERWLREPTFWADHIHPDDRAWVMAFCVGHTTSGSSHEFEYRMIASDGRIVWLKDIVTVITEAGKPVWSQGLMVDITERKRLEAALQEQNEHLKQLDVLKSELLDTAAHELRTPLASIQGFAEFLEDEVEGPLTTGQREHVTRIQQGARRLQDIVDKMLDVARWESGGLQLVRETTDLGALVAEIVDSLSPLAREAKVTLRAVVPDAPVAFAFDARRVEQVLMNLVGNALKFTPSGGQVAVTLTPQPDRVRVEVADTGIGVAPEHRDRIFEKFYQADGSTTREFGGAGLGLAIARALVDAHHGQIGVESVPGHGATFWFTLPLRD